MTTDAKNRDFLAELRRRSIEAEAGGGAERREREHKAGKLTARERVGLLLDEGTFEELDKFVAHRSDDFGMDEQRPPGDGFITGFGRIDGRLVYVFAQDFTVFGGSLSETNAAENLQNHGPGDAQRRAGDRPERFRRRAHSGRACARSPGYADIFLRNTLASGVVPQISAIMGPCAGGAVYSPAITDFIFMTRDTSYMFITGPDVIKTVTHEDVTKQELGGAMTHNATSGVAPFHRRATTPNACAMIRELLELSAVEQSAMTPPRAPHCRSRRPRGRRARLDRSRRSDAALRHQGRDPRRRRRRLFLRGPRALREKYRGGFRAPRMAARRHRRQSAGVSRGRAGYQRFGERRAIRALLRRLQYPADHVRRRARIFARHAAGMDGIIRHGAKLLYAFAEATVPKITVITRKAYGGAYCVMSSKHIRTDVNFAWPTAEIAVMGPEGAVNIVYKREIERAPEADRERLRREKVAEFRERFANPYVAAERGYIDAVIEPSQTRAKLITALRSLENKRDTNPKKKHGNIPL